MPRYVSQLNHNGIPAGTEVDIPEDEVEQWAGEIEAGFLVPVYDPPEIDYIETDVPELLDADLPAEPDEAE